MNNLTIGSDPEFFVMDKKRKKIVTSFSVLGEACNKENKLELGKGISTFCDNALMEFTMPYGMTTKQTRNNFRELIGRANELLNKQGCTLVAKASHHFDKEQLEHPIAQLVGCSEEYCSFEKRCCEPPFLAATTLRSGGGHIHLGNANYKNPKKDEMFLLDFQTKIAAIRAMDRTVGVFDVFLNGSRKASRERRLIYGKAGRHRTPVYGAEYRTSSNELFTRPEIVEFVDQLTRKTLVDCEKNVDMFLDDTFDKEINLATARNIIDNNWVGEARKYLSKVLDKEDFDEACALRRMKYEPILENNW